VVIGIAGASEVEAGGHRDLDATLDAPADGSASAGEADLETEIRRRRAAGESVRDLAAALARERGVSRRAVYRLALTTLAAGERDD